FMTLIAIAVLGFASFAIRAGAETPREQALEREVAALRAKVKSLEERLAALESAVARSHGAAQPAEERPPARVGQIIIVGNTKTAGSVILKQLPFSPGACLNYQVVRTGERNLARLNRFVVDPAKGIRPTIMVLDPDPDNPVKDIMVNVQEK